LAVAVRVTDVPTEVLVELVERDTVKEAAFHVTETVLLGKKLPPENINLAKKSLLPAVVLDTEAVHCVPDLQEVSCVLPSKIMTEEPLGPRSWSVIAVRVTEVPTRTSVLLADNRMDVGPGAGGGGDPPSPPPPPPPQDIIKPAKKRNEIRVVAICLFFITFLHI